MNVTEFVNIRLFVTVKVRFGKNNIQIFGTEEKIILHLF